MDVRVRLSETDALGVVYYGQYFTYFDVARLEMLRRAGVTLVFLRRKKLGFVAAKAVCRYVSSAKLDDLLTLEAAVAKIGTTSVVYSHRIWKGKKAVAEGEVTDVLVGADGKPKGIPAGMRAQLMKCKR
ncbi:MAG: acyl-CoA thioesterase [Thaumarchaeota archaeon]|nr:acyl-CoA thioesterase [Nitrososphaerota archaeon]